MTARDALRLLGILRRLLPLAASFRRDLRRWLRWGAPVPRTVAFHAARAEQLVEQLAALGPTFVKLGQIFSSRADVVPEPYLTALGTLTDRVPPEPWPVIRAVMARAWNADPDTVLDGLDPAPLAAGSLGQVHRARVGGRDVVVKVLRPNIEEILMRDVRAFGVIIDWVYRRFPHHHVRAARVVLDEFAVHVFEEIDFVREGEQCTRMRARFADEPRLIIPEILPALTRRETLVMQYVEGTRIDGLGDRLARGQLRLTTLLETLIEVYARMMLRDGVFHADPHAGNLLVDAQGRLVLLDFGMVIDVDVVTRKALFDTVLAAIRRDPEATTDGFFALGMVAPETTRDTMRALVVTLLDIAYAETAMQERARMLADRVMRELFDWPIVLPGELVYFARTAALIEGIGSRYDSHFNSIRVASPVVLRLRRELIVALVGEDGARDPVIAWAATAGAVAGGAVAWLDGARRRWLASS